MLLVEPECFVDLPPTALEFTSATFGAPSLREPDSFLDRLSGSFIPCVFFFVLRTAAPKPFSAITGNSGGSLSGINIPGSMSPYATSVARTLSASRCQADRNVTQRRQTRDKELHVSN